MTWTAPATFAADQYVNETDLNTQLRDNMLALLHPYDYSPSDVDVASTAAETSIWSKVITGGQMGVNGLLALRIYGDFLYNNSGVDTITLRVKFGGSTIFADGSTLDTVSASRQPWILDIWIGNRGAANSQIMFGAWMSNRESAGPTTGIGSFANDAVRHFTTFGSNGPTSVDTAADQTFQITAQWSASSANNSFRKRLAVLHLGRN